MKVYRTKPGVFGRPDRLFLEAETDKDRKLLAELVRDCQLINYGRDGTDSWQHVGIELIPLEVRNES